MKTIEDNKVRAAIQSALNVVKAGEAFIGGGDLKDSDYDRILEEVTLDKYFRYVAKSMAQSLSPKQKVKKTEKVVSELLQSKSDVWIKEIRNLVQETSVDDAKSETGELTQSLDVEGTTEIPKKSKKRKPESKSPKKNPKQKMPRRESKSPKKTSISAAELEIARAQAKKDFEEEKAAILAEVPEQHKSKWGQVGFGKWGKDWLPCLTLSPYDVGATSLMRDQWMTMFENTKDRRNAMTFLVFWYGSADISSSYSFLAAANVKTYDDAVKMSLDKVPTKIQKKIDAGKSLTNREKDLLRGLEEMREDLEKAPEERIKGERKELYEMDDYVTVMAAEQVDKELLSDSSEEEQELDDENRKPEAAKEITKPGQRPVDEMDFAEDEVSADDSHDKEVEPPSSSENDEDDVDFDEKKATTKPPSKKEGKRSIQRQRSKPKKEVTEETKKRNERKIFVDNENKFIPMLEQLEAAITSKDTNTINRIVREMLDNVESLGAPFIEAYEVSPLLKAAKGILRDQHMDTSAHKQLWTKLADLYKEKKAMVPEGYAPRKLEKVPKSARKTGHGVSRPEKDDNEALEQEKAPKSALKSEHGVSRPEKDDKVPTEPPNSKDRESAGASAGSQPTEAAPPFLVRKELPRDLSALSPKQEMESLSQGSKVTSQKPEKTSFSLNKLFNPDPSSLRAKSDESARSGRKSLQKESVKILPSWITSAPGDIGPLLSEEVDRLFALEFFEGAASRFPADKCNRDSIARALEAAVYQWCQEQYKKEDTYWNKVHAVVAGICGKTQPGTLVAAIMAGEYASARDVVALPDDVFRRSFEG